MPKKNANGGKKHRRAKNLQENNFVDIPSEGQYFAKVIKILGSGRVSCEYYIPRLDIKNNNLNWDIKSSIGVIRGKMLKRIYINMDDIILVTERDFDKSKVDIIEKYNQSQLHYLKNKVAFPKINIIQDDDDICFESHRKRKTEKTEQISYQNLYSELDAFDELDEENKLNNDCKYEQNIVNDDDDVNIDNL